MTVAQSFSATDPRVARTIDGKALARTIGAETARQVAELHARTETPLLAAADDAPSS